MKSTKFDRSEEGITPLALEATTCGHEESSNDD
jgi:hypothetical protein